MLTRRSGIVRACHPRDEEIAIVEGRRGNAECRLPNADLGGVGEGSEAPKGEAGLTVCGQMLRCFADGRAPGGIGRTGIDEGARAGGHPIEQPGRSYRAAQRPRRYRPTIMAVTLEARE